MVRKCQPKSVSPEESEGPILIEAAGKNFDIMLSTLLQIDLHEYALQFSVKFIFLLSLLAI